MIFSPLLLLRLAELQYDMFLRRLDHHLTKDQIRVRIGRLGPLETYPYKPRAQDDEEWDPFDEE